MKKLFGTNGVRGVFSEDFTLEFVNDLAMSLAVYFKQGKIKPNLYQTFRMNDFVSAFNVFKERKVMGKVTLEIKPES